ncbi:MAG: dCTP deaminase [Candidatus Parvarchaeum sp.]
MMSFLNDKQILAAMKKNELIALGGDEKAVTPNGYDLSIETMNTLIEAPGFPLVCRSLFTKEYLKMPKDVIGILHLRSRFVRVGAFGSFGIVDAGFEGHLQFSIYAPKEMWELFEKSADKRMVQIIFYKLSEEVAIGYAGRSGNFQGMKPHTTTKTTEEVIFKGLEL